METLANASRAKRVWRQRTSGRVGERLVGLPESGSFDIIFVEVDEDADRRRKTSARDMIGFCRRFRKPRTTEEWMRELREGEDG